jgi:hypothetical protein
MNHQMKILSALVALAFAAPALAAAPDDFDLGGGVSSYQRFVIYPHLEKGVAARPVYASSYFGGNMAPERYAEMISGLTENNHLNVWVQDGAGTGKLSAAGRALYLDAVSRCPNPAARGIVYELFRQTGPDTAFKAEALPAAQAEAIAARRAPCNGDSVFFSLRYLPGLPLAIAG